jgi:hypothetical protein
VLASDLENTSKFVLAVASEPTEAKLSALVKNTEAALPPSVPASKFAVSTCTRVYTTGNCSSDTDVCVYKCIL